MSSSTPKKPVLNRAKKKSSDQSSVSDFCRLCKCSFKTIYGNFPSKSTSGELSEEQQPKTSYISTENIFNVSCRRGQERPSLNSILEQLGFTLLQSDLLSSRVCRKCATKVRNAEPAITFIRQELNRAHHSFEHQQEGKFDQDKENDVREERFKRMAKSPHGSQKPKVSRTTVEIGCEQNRDCSQSTVENDGSKRIRPALGARRSLVMTPGMEDKVKDVSEDLLSDKMFSNVLTTLESEDAVKDKGFVRVIISDSRLTVRTPHDSLASSIIKNILKRKWQHVVNMLFKVEEAGPHLQDAITKAVNREFKWFCHSNSTLTMKSPEQIVNYTNKSLLDETSKKCPIYYSCILGTAGLIGKQKEMDWKTVNATAAATAVLAKKRNARMSAFAYRVSSILIHSGAKTADFTRLNRLGICMSHTETVKKQKEMGENFDAHVLRWKEEVENEKATTNATASVEAEANQCTSSGTSVQIDGIEEPASFKRYRYVKDVL